MKDDMNEGSFMMATAPSGRAGKVTNGAKDRTPEDLEAEIARLRDDISRLTAQLSATGEHSVSAAKRAASEGAAQMRVKGEAAMDSLRSNADDMEQQITEAVREKPITALAIAAGVGFFFALLTRR
ncbi:hypothetical protein [Mesorhizobium sp. CAU 1741]|uniref:DUF883 family protein n=1 Tax=Mesorhizobium sp. CAU 1741 TaxID=3140366 RepID=UPI00325BE150